MEPEIPKDVSIWSETLENQNPLIYEIVDNRGRKQLVFEIVPGGKNHIIPDNSRGWKTRLRYYADWILDDIARVKLFGKRTVKGAKRDVVEDSLQLCKSAIDALMTNEQYWGDQIWAIYEFYLAVKRESDKILHLYGNLFWNLEEFRIPEIPQKEISKCITRLQVAQRNAITKALKGE